LAKIYPFSFPRAMTELENKEQEAEGKEIATDTHGHRRRPAAGRKGTNVEHSTFNIELGKEPPGFAQMLRRGKRRGRR
jgi:hypothetical protein